MIYFFSHTQISEHRGNSVPTLLILFFLFVKHYLLYIVPTPVKVRGSMLEVVDEYVYLGQILQIGRANLE